MYKTQPTKHQYDEMIERLNKMVEMYETTDFKYNEIKAFLSNGQRLEFSFKKQHIPHLLGINIGILKNSKILNATSPFEMLKELIERSGYVYNKIIKGEIRFFDIFSDYIEEKIEAFPTILKFNLKDIHFACEYVKARAYINGEANNYGCPYYIALKNEDEQYVILGLNKDDDVRYYAPSSIITCFSKEETEKTLETLIGNQMITIVNAVKFHNNGFSYHLKIQDKLLLVNELIELDARYKSISSTSSDFLFSIGKASSYYNDIRTLENIMTSLTLAVRQGETVDASVMTSAKEMNNSIYLKLLESYNLSIKSSERKDITSEIDELKKLREELDEANKRIKMQEQQLYQKSETIKLQEKTLEEQGSELERLRSFEEESIQLVKKYCPKADN